MGRCRFSCRVLRNGVLDCGVGRSGSVSERLREGAEDLWSGSRVGANKDCALCSQGLPVLN